MIVRSLELRRLLRASGASQVAEDAIVVLAAALEDRARSFADASVAALERRNGSRDVQRIPRLRRVTVHDVEEGLRRSDGKS